MIRSPFQACLMLPVLLTLLAPVAAHAQARPGAHGGVSIDPDQFFLGGHIETAPLVEQLRFRPSLDIGIGDDATTIGFNFEFTYAFTSFREWNLYAGGGPAVNWLDVDGESDTEAAFNVLAGVKRDDGLFFEVKIGARSSPDVKFGVGYTFR